MIISNIISITALAVALFTLYRVTRKENSYQDKYDENFLSMHERISRNYIEYQARVLELSRKIDKNSSGTPKVSTKEPVKRDHKRATRRGPKKNPSAKK